MNQDGEFSSCEVTDVQTVRTITRWAAAGFIFLASAAADYITGSLILVDGGYLLT